MEKDEPPCKLYGCQCAARPFYGSALSIIANPDTVQVVFRGLRNGSAIRLQQDKYRQCLKAHNIGTLISSDFVWSDQMTSCTAPKQASMSRRLSR